ncbi:hypothetical protein OIU79_000685, partial [Salix purpurea]
MEQERRRDEAGREIKTLWMAPECPICEGGLGLCSRRWLLMKAVWGEVIGVERRADGEGTSQSPEGAVEAVGGRWRGSLPWMAGKEEQFPEQGDDGEEKTKAEARRGRVGRQGGVMERNGRVFYFSSFLIFFGFYFRDP